MIADLAPPQHKAPDFAAGEMRAKYEILGAFKVDPERRRESEGGERKFRMKLHSAFPPGTKPYFRLMSVNDVNPALSVPSRLFPMASPRRLESTPRRSETGFVSCARFSALLELNVVSSFFRV